MIYFDNNSTTRVDDRVLAAMLPYFTADYGNASSRHSLGTRANEAVGEARQAVADLLHCQPNEVIFTSGATEAINLALKGVAGSTASRGRHIITVATEHPAVLDTCCALQKDGCEVTYLPVNNQGLLDLIDLRNSLRPDTVLVAVMIANNETGVIQPIREIASITHQHGALFMTDATQAAGKVPIDVNELGIDLLALSAHKFHGPKGVGCLYSRNTRPHKVKLSTLIHGGGHERNLRSGTLNVPAIVGLGEAALLAKQEMAIHSARIGMLRDQLEAGLLDIPGSRINGSLNSRLYNSTNIRFEGVDADAVIATLKDIVLSNGSACSSHSIEPSHVLTAMGLNSTEAISSLRLSLSKYNTLEEISATIPRLDHLIRQLREMA